MKAKGEPTLYALIVENFRTGCSRVYGRRIWQFLMDLQGGSQEELGQVGGFDNSPVSRGLRHGYLSFSQFVVFAMGLKFQFCQLPLMPPTREVATIGLLYAMEQVVNKEKLRKEKPKPNRPLRPVDLELIRQVWRDKGWLKTKDRKKREEILTRVRVGFSGSLQEALQKITYPLVDYIEELERDWSATLTECMLALHFELPWTKTNMIL